MDTVPGFRVGISWQGNREHRLDRLRSIPLSEFAPLAQVEGVRLLSLQKGQGSEQLREVAARTFAVVDWTDRIDEASGPFMDTAALMKNLDLVITSDTANAHLAGGAGGPGMGGSAVCSRVALAARIERTAPGIRPCVSSVLANGPGGRRSSNASAANFRSSFSAAGSRRPALVKMAHSAKRGVTRLYRKRLASFFRRTSGATTPDKLPRANA